MFHLGSFARVLIDCGNIFCVSYSPLGKTWVGLRLNRLLSLPGFSEAVSLKSSSDLTRELSRFSRAFQSPPPAFLPTSILSNYYHNRNIEALPFGHYLGAFSYLSYFRFRRHTLLRFLVLPVIVHLKLLRKLALLCFRVQPLILFPTLCYWIVAVGLSEAMCKNVSSHLVTPKSSGLYSLSSMYLRATYPSLLKA